MYRIVYLYLLFFSSIAVAGTPSEQAQVDWQEIEKQLTGEGLGGWVHGNFESQQLFVFTWRHPDNFFVNLQLPMVPGNDTAKEQIMMLRRHDYVVIKGSFIKNNAPLRHMKIDEFVKIDKWEGPGADIDYKYKASLEKEIVNKDFATFKIHAVDGDGSVLVVEYKDIIIPVFNSQPKMAAGLYRNDIIYLKYKVREAPFQPVHLEIDYDRKDPLLVLEKIVKGHGEKVEMVGSLVMFPKSPQIIFNVYALREKDTNGLTRNYTLVNFEDIDLFLALREKLEEAWKAKEDSAEYDRNKFINRKILIRARGTKNVIHPGQANPQILIKDMKDLEIEFLD